MQPNLSSSNPSHHNATIAKLHDLRQQAVRDLAWSCFSAPLMQDLPGSNAQILPHDNQSLWPWLEALDKEPQPLLDHLAQVKSTRLGIYYEALWHFYFANHPEWELLQHNLQIDRAGITLGAFDFLCRRNNEYWHIETAVKFYLCSTRNTLEGSEWKYWIGPEGKDRLDLKLNHLRQHQLPLHQNLEAKEQLETRYPTVSHWNTGLCLQGYLFSPAQHPSQPAFSSKVHARGDWWFASQLIEQLSEQLSTQERQYWLILERKFWLSPAQAESSEQLLGNEQFIEKIRGELTSAKRPLLIAAMKKHLTANAEYWAESERLFAVADDWPTNLSVPA